MEDFAKYRVRGFCFWTMFRTRAIGVCKTVGMLEEKLV
jgi:hypothetical protein